MDHTQSDYTPRSSALTITIQILSRVKQKQNIYFQHCISSSNFESFSYRPFKVDNHNELTATPLVFFSHTQPLMPAYHLR